MRIDRARLARVLEMMSSTHDGEALNAARAATKMVRDAGVTWEQVLSGRTGAPGMPSAPDYRTPPSKRGTTRYGRPAPKQSKDERRVTGDDIDTMLSEVGARRLEVSTMMFVAGLLQDWERKGYLTVPQYEALFRLHENKPDRGGGGRWRF